MITRLPRLVLSAVSGLVLATGLFAQAPAISFPEPSPAATIKQRVGITDLEISFNRPGMKGRQVFGGLVPYDEVWRTGANTATTLSLSTAVKFNGTEVPAGHYELFTIPGRTEWTIIIHKAMSQWGSYSYDMKNDVARIKATPVPLAQPVETFAIGFNDLRDESATLNLMWELVRVPVKIEVDYVGTLVSQIEAVMASEEPRKPYFQAAMFYYDHNLDLKKSLAWIDAAITAQPAAFYIVYRKALIQAKAGDKAGAIATAKASIEGANKDPKTPASLRDEYVRLNNALISSLK